MNNNLSELIKNEIEMDTKNLIAENRIVCAAILRLQDLDFKKAVKEFYDYINEISSNGNFTDEEVSELDEKMYKIKKLSSKYKNSEIFMERIEKSRNLTLSIDEGEKDLLKVKELEKYFSENILTEKDKYKIEEYNAYCQKYGIAPINSSILENEEEKKNVQEKQPKKVGRYVLMVGGVILAGTLLISSIKLSKEIKNLKAEIDDDPKKSEYVDDTNISAKEDEIIIPEEVDEADTLQDPTNDEEVSTIANLVLKDYEQFVNLNDSEKEEKQAEFAEMIKFFNGAMNSELNQTKVEEVFNQYMADLTEESAYYANSLNGTGLTDKSTPTIKWEKMLTADTEAYDLLKDFSNKKNDLFEAINKENVNKDELSLKASELLHDIYRVWPENGADDGYKGLSEIELPHYRLFYMGQVYSMMPIFYAIDPNLSFEEKAVIDGEEIVKTVTVQNVLDYIQGETCEDLENGQFINELSATINELGKLGNLEKPKVLTRG